MVARKIEVNTPPLAAGGSLCRDAGDSARKAAEELAGTAVASKIFGDFAEANQFHGTVSTAHLRHQEQLHGHHATLTDVSDKVVKAAQAFTATDGSEGDAIDSAGAVIE